MMDVFIAKINPIEHRKGNGLVFTDEWSLGCSQMNTATEFLLCSDWDGNLMPTSYNIKGIDRDGID